MIQRIHSLAAISKCDNKKSGKILVKNSSTELRVDLLSAGYIF